MSVSLDWLRAFEAAARNGSFTGAAKELHLTQSAISQQVRALEHRLGGTLFVREPRGVTLTELGNHLLFDVSNGLEVLDTCLQRIGNRGEGVLEVASNISFAECWLAPRLHEFLAAYPRARINFTVTLWPNEFRKLSAGVELRYGARQYGDENAVPLGIDELHPVCAPATARGIHDVADLAGQTLIEVSAVGDTWSYWAQTLGLTMPESLRMLTVNHQASALVVARAGGGVALGSRVLCRQLLDSGELVTPLPLAVKRRHRYWSILKDPSDPNASAFHRWVVRHASQGR